MTFNLKASGVNRADAEVFRAIARSRTCGFSIRGVMAFRPAATVSQAHEFLENMLACNLLKMNARHGGYEMTHEGHDLAASNLRDRLSPEAARITLEKALDKVRVWNANPDRFVSISQVKLFGSYLYEISSFGDVDIEVDVVPRKLDADAQKRLDQDAPDKVKNSLLYHLRPELALVSHQANLALRHVDRASPDLAACPAGTIESIGAEWMDVYVFDPKSEKEKSPSGTRYPRAFPMNKEKIEQRSRGTELIRPEPEGVTPEIASFGQISAAGLARLGERYWLGSGMDETLDIGKAGPYRLSQMKAIDDQAGYDLDATDMFGKIRETHHRGIEAGLLTPGPIRFKFKKNNMSCTLPMKNGYDATFRMWHEGSTKDIDLLPEIVPAQDRPQFGSGPSVRPGHVAIARSLAGPMFEAHDAMKIRVGIDVRLSFTWDGEECLVMPSLGPLTRAVVNEARNLQVDASILPALLECHGASLERHRGTFIRQDLDVSMRAEHDCILDFSARSSSGVRGEKLFVRDEWPEADLREKIDQASLRLDQLGPDWSLDLKREHSEGIFDEVFTVEDLQGALEDAGIKVVDDAPSADMEPEI